MLEAKKFFYQNAKNASEKRGFYTNLALDFAARLNMDLNLILLWINLQI